MGGRKNPTHPLKKGMNKRSEFSLLIRTKDFITGFYKGTDRANAGTMVQDRSTRPFVDALMPAFKGLMSRSYGFENKKKHKFFVFRQKKVDLLWQYHVHP